MKRLDHYWYSRNPIALLLWPVSLLFCALVRIRRLAYRRGWLSAVSLPVPVVVVGNITVGGSGKTPLVVWLADYLRAAGYRPGIVSRGYGGAATEWPQPVTLDSDPRQVGDEPVLIARRCDCPMWVGPDRVAAAEALLREHDCDVIISDDGMQHYRLGRKVEIAVIDGYRGQGNGFCLPAGPLREPASRLKEIDLIVCNGGCRAGQFVMELHGESAIPLAGGEGRSVVELRRVHAVAGIGNPQRFFHALERLGLEVMPHPFPDHHAYTPHDLRFDNDAPVLMTEKDAVKCRHYALANAWYLPVTARLPEGFGERLLTLLKR